MFIIMDTNILVQDFKLQSYHYQKLQQSSDRFGIKLFLSAVVFDETVQKYKEKLENFNNKNKEFYRFIPDQYLKSISDSEIDKLTTEYEEYLHHSLYNFNSYGTRFLPISNDDFWAVYQKALNKIKPFKKDKEKGFRDALIWEHIKNIVLTYCDEEKKLAFITNNPKDFSDSEQNLNKAWYLPSKELIKDYAQKGYPEDAVRIYTSLQAFNTDVLYKKIDVANSYIDKLNSTDNQVLINNLYNEIEKDNIFDGYSDVLGKFQYKIKRISKATVIDALSSYGNSTDEIIFCVKLELLCEITSHNINSYWTVGEAYVHIDTKTNQFLYIESVSIVTDLE